jgi:hypothetical protein
MAISRTSRYQTNQTALFTDRNGQAQLAIVHQAPVARTLVVRDALWKDSTRVDSVAAAYYRAEDAWWVFAQANPQTLDWTSPAAGTAVMIPSGVA